MFFYVGLLSPRRRALFDKKQFQSPSLLTLKRFQSPRIGNSLLSRLRSNQIFHPFNYLSRYNLVSLLQLLQNLFSLNHVTKNSIATVQQIQASGSQFRLKQEKEKLRRTAIRFSFSTGHRHSTKAEKGKTGSSR